MIRALGPACRALSAALVFVFVFVFGWGSGSRAQAAEPTVAVAPVTSSMPMEDVARTQLYDALVGALERSGATVKRIAPDCADPSCRDLAASDYLLEADVEADDRDYRVHLTLSRGPATVVSTSTEVCELCGFAEVCENAAAQAVKLLQRARVASAPPVLFVRSTPPGARVEIDGVHVGVSPLRQEVSAGRHDVVLRLDGYFDRRATVQAVAGVEELVTLPLSRRAPDRGPWLRGLGWASLASSTAFFATGATFIALEEQPVRLRCDGADRDPAGNCRYQHNTRAAGIAVTSLGVALLATGIGLLVRDRQQRRRSTAWSRRPVARRWASP